LGLRFRRDKVVKAGQKGPDFGIIHSGATIWIEAIVPAPEGIPEDYLRTPGIGEVVVKSMPHQEMLLRWTAALKEKRAKLQRYIETGIIEATEPTAIAINECRLCDFAVDDRGISQMPFAVGDVSGWADSGPDFTRRTPGRRSAAPSAARDPR
jgi:type I restriction enzyme S subunit